MLNRLYKFLFLVRGVKIETENLILKTQNTRDGSIIKNQHNQFENVFIGKTHITITDEDIAVNSTTKY